MRSSKRPRCGLAELRHSRSVCLSRTPAVRRRRSETRRAGTACPYSARGYRRSPTIPESTTRTAIVVAVQKLGMRYGSVWPMPPSVVISPHTNPRVHGWPRPVRLPSSDSASANPMEIPAPTEAAMPTRNADQLSCVAKAAANSGASVDTDPSMRPTKPGCTICSTNMRRAVSPSRTLASSETSCSSRCAVPGDPLRCQPGRPAACEPPGRSSARPRLA